MKLEVVYEGFPTLRLIPENELDEGFLIRLRNPSNLQIWYDPRPMSPMDIYPRKVRATDKTS